jgi:hypothetical protein
MPLTLRPTDLKPRAAHDRHPDWTVLTGGMIVGRIYDRSGIGGDPDVRWFWAINGGVHGPPSVMQITGHAPSFEQAKAELRANWHKWLAWARLLEIAEP